MDATSASPRASRAAHGMPGWVPPLARVGYAAKGIVYIGVGWLSAAAGFGQGSGATGSREAIATMARESAGRPVLWLIGLGLVGYVVWRLVQALLDPEEEGGASRAVFLVSGLVYAGLAWWTVQAARGDASGGGSSGGSGGVTAELMGQSAGRWLVMAGGIAVAGYGLVQFWKAYRAQVADRLKPDLAAGTRRWVVRAARIGLVARGAVMVILGSLLVVAGWSADPVQRQGLGGALQTLRQQPYGPWLMGVVALGLVAYGIYQLVQARYRRIGPMAA